MAYNSFRITFFAHPIHLTPIESHSCKKQGGGEGEIVGYRPGTSLTQQTGRMPGSATARVSLVLNYVVRGTSLINWWTLPSLSLNAVIHRSCVGIGAISRGGATISTPCPTSR